MLAGTSILLPPQLDPWRHAAACLPLGHDEKYFLEIIGRRPVPTGNPRHRQSARPAHRQLFHPPLRPPRHRMLHRRRRCANAKRSRPSRRPQHRHRRTCSLVRQRHPPLPPPTGLLILGPNRLDRRSPTATHCPASQQPAPTSPARWTTASSSQAKLPTPTTSQTAQRRLPIRPTRCLGSNGVTAS